MTREALRPPPAPGPTPAHSTHLPPERRLGLIGLACVIFCITCGGAFGLESLVGAVGAGWAMVLILVTPLLWSLPIALMVAELAGLMPVEGGYYVWVRDALGRFWGVQEGFWTLAYSMVLMAIFPVLFVNYLAYFVPSLALGADGSAPWTTLAARWWVALLVIVSSTAVNLRGAQSVGRYAQTSVVLVVGAFALLAVWGLVRPNGVATAMAAIGRDLTRERAGALLLGLSTVIFNYSGWDNVSTIAGEVDDPPRNYPRALGAALLLNILVYVLPVLAGLGVSSDPSVWNADAGWPVLAQLIGGPGLGAVLAATGLVSMWALFNGNQLFVSRLPYVMAGDGWLPPSLAEASRETGAPRAALIGSAVLSAIFAALSFGNLVVLYVLLYAAALALEFLALVLLRVRQPEARRAFRVPGGWPGLAYVSLAPLAVAVAVLLAALREEESHSIQLLVVGLILASGVGLYLARRGQAGGRRAAE